MYFNAIAYWFLPFAHGEHETLYYRNPPYFAHPQEQHTQHTSQHHVSRTHVHADDTKISTHYPDTTTATANGSTHVSTSVSTFPWVRVSIRSPLFARISQPHCRWCADEISTKHKKTSTVLKKRAWNDTDFY